MKTTLKNMLLVCFGAAILLFHTVASAETPLGTVRYRDHYQLDALGNAHIVRTMQFPAVTYAKVKAQAQDPLMLLRSFSSQMDWHETTIVSSRFDDRNRQVILELDQKGLAQTIGEGRWEIPARSEPGEMELITCSDQKVIFHTAQPSEWGTMSATIAVDLHECQTEARFDVQDNAIRFRAIPPAATVDSDADAWHLEATPRLMSSLSKVYSNEDFGLFWTGRSVFTNTSDQPIRKYQTRFRLEGYSSWSPWKRTPIVYPGQSVVQPFFPVLDIDELSRLDGSRRANLIAEYRYVDGEGKTVEESDSQTLEILSRNEVVFSRHANEAALNWAEANEYLPMVLASFCTSNDPVIQQLAGRISGMASGPAASLASEDAIRYLKATWKFLEDNKVAYQTSPTLSVEDHFGQHIKYGRDVLKNRAGTCIDLAVFWASAAKAVGLKSYIMVIPGHAFPVIELPNGRKIPVEATLLGQKLELDDAVKKGSEEMEQALQGPHFLVDVDGLQDFGVRPLDLERVSEDFLDKLNYEFVNLEE